MKNLFIIFLSVLPVVSSSQDSVFTQKDVLAINVGLPSFTLSYESKINERSSIFTQSGMVLLFPLYHDAMFFQKERRRKDETLLGNWAAFTLQSEYRNYLSLLKRKNTEHFWAVRGEFFSKDLFHDTYFKDQYMRSYRLGMTYGMKRKLKKKIQFTSSFGLAAWSNYDFSYVVPAIIINNRIGFQIN